MMNTAEHQLNELTASNSKGKQFLVDDSTNLLHYLSSSECDIQRICRLCLKVKCKTQMVSLLTSIESVNLAAMLQSLSSIEILPDEELPYHTCPDCLQLLLKCSEFKSTCEKSNYTLKSLYKGEYVKEEPIDECKIELIPLDCILEDLDVHSISKEKNIDTQINLNAEKVASKTGKKPAVQKVKKNKKKRIFSVSDSLTNNQVEDANSPSNTESLECKKCKETFLSQRDYELHSILHTHKGGKWKCIECQKEFKCKSQLRRHIGRHMQHKKHQCDICDKSFSELYAMYRHRRVHTGERLPKKHACPLCDKRFTEAAPMRAHVQAHSGARPWPCALCHKTFPSARLLNSHMLVHDERKLHACSYCDRRFRHESTRHAHERTHTGERPYVCSVCGKTFMQSSNLTLHMRVHSGEKPYKCKVCDSRFSSSSSLKNHERIHTGEKPFSCQVCGKRFARCDLRGHMRRHTGERPHSCAACSRRFYTASRLQEHTTVMHTGYKPFECAFCQEKYATKSHLIKHLKTHQEKNKDNRNILVVHRVTDDAPYFLQDNLLVGDKTDIAEEIVISQQDSEISNSEMTMALNTIPIEMNTEIPEDNTNTEIIVVKNLPNECAKNICLTSDGMNYDLNDVNLVTVSEEEMSIAAANTAIDGSSVKLYQLDQSLLQIHSSGGQLTISKITSKMTANFE